MALQWYLVCSATPLQLPKKLLKNRLEVASNRPFCPPRAAPASALSNARNASRLKDLVQPFLHPPNQLSSDLVGLVYFDSHLF